MFTGFSNIFKNINERQEICKSVTMATQGSHHGALQNFSFFFTVVAVLFLCIFVRSKSNIPKLIFVKEQLYFDMSVKFDMFPKIKLENIEILSSAEILSNNVTWRRYVLPRSSFWYRFTNFTIISINKFFDLRFCSYITLIYTSLCITD